MEGTITEQVIGAQSPNQVETIDMKDVAMIMADVAEEHKSQTWKDWLKSKLPSYWKGEKTPKNDKTWKCYAVMIQPQEDDVFWDDKDVSTKLVGWTPNKRPNVVCQTPRELTEDQLLQKRLNQAFKPRSKRWYKRQNALLERISPRIDCPFTKMQQEDCWCLHKKEHAKVCYCCGDRYYGDHDCGNDQYDWYNSDDDHYSYSDSASDYELDDECREQAEELGRSIRFQQMINFSDVEEQMPKDSEVEYEPTVLIHIYLKEVTQNIHWMIGEWTHEHVMEIRQLCFKLLKRIRIMDHLVGGSCVMHEHASNRTDTLQKQKERMFVYTSNASIRIRQCNKLINDYKILHKIRPAFISEAQGALVDIGSIRTMVNEARQLVVQEQMEPHGDSDFAMPHNKPATRVAFTGDKAQDENALFSLGSSMNITDVVERCKIPSRLDVITFPTTATATQALARYRVSPNYCPRFVDAATRTYNQTALCNYANIYEFWKGSLIYTFEVVKTPFHMGQIYIAFNPASVAAPTFAQCSNLLFKVMDLKDTNRLDFEVEYVGETEYKQCVSSAVGPAVATDPYVNIANVGTLNVFVFAPLTAPTIVAPQVEINVYVRAGDNFTFKAPTKKTEGLSYYNVRGAVYEQMETQYDTELPPVVAQPPQGLVRDNRLEVARAAKLNTADTNNVMNRRYPLRAGVEWDSTDTIAAPLTTVVLPRDVLNATNLSISGLISYHAYFRGKFSIMWEMNAPLQYAGMLIMFYVPNGVDYLECSDSTWTQFPHVFFNPANETIAVLDIPWSYVTPMNSLDPNGSLNTMGRVFIHPWNGLQIPVGGVNLLTGVVSFSILDPEISVKRTNYVYAAALPRHPRSLEVEEQMEPTSGGGTNIIKQTSDSALKSEDQQGVFQGKPVTMEAIMVQDHTNIYSLLRRADFIDAEQTTVPTTAVWTQIMTLPPFCGAMHNFLRNSFAFSNGSNKISFIIPVGANRGVTLASFPTFTDADFSDVVTSTPVTISVRNFYKGTSIWRPGLALEHTVEIPWYHRDPVISIPDTTRVYQCEYANVRLAALNNDTATEVYIQAAHTIGPDFKLYFPIAFGKFRTAIPVLEEEKKSVPAGVATAVKSVAEVAESQKSYPKDFQVTLPKPPTLPVPRQVVEAIVDHIAEGTNLNKETIRDIGSSILHARGHHDMADAMAESLALRPMLGMRRRRDVQECPDCSAMTTDCKWPDSVPIPMKRTGDKWPLIVNGTPKEAEGFALDYDNVHIHTHGTPDLDVPAIMERLNRCIKRIHPSKVQEQMPAGGFSGTTTNSQTISQLFPGIATTGEVNTIQLNGVAICTSNVATDLVDVEYAIGFLSDTVTYLTTVTGTQVSPTVINMTIPSTPVNTTLSVTINTFGTGVVEHAVTLSAYRTVAASGTIPVVITGQPIRVTEYANLMSVDESAYGSDIEVDGCGHDVTNFICPCRVVEQMDNGEDFVDASEDAIPTYEEEMEAEVFASSFCNKITGTGRNAVAVFCEAFTGIHSWITSKCNNVVKKSACDKIKNRLKEISDSVLDKILPVIIWMIDFISNLYVLFNTQSSTMRTLMIASLSAKCVLAYREGTQLVDKLEELFGVQDETVKVSYQSPQFLENNLPLISGLVASAMLAGILGLLGKSVLGSDVQDIRKLSSWKFAESCAMLSKMSSAVKSVPTLWTAADAGVKSAISFFIEGPDCFKNWEEKNHTKLVQWQKDYDEGLKNNRFVNAGLFRYEEGELETNYQKLRKLADFATEIRMYGSSIPHFNRVWTITAHEVIKNFATAEKLVQTTNGRAEPVGVIVRGEAGCGKSLLFSQFLPHAVLLSLKKTTSYEDTQRQTYAKPTDPKADFWDGYLGDLHKWVNIDDFGQTRTEEDIGSIYNLISSSDAPVNMAELTDKGILFKSDFVCCTTNLANFSCLTSIRQSSALVRRFPISVSCRVNPAFQKADKTLDHSKMITHLSAVGNKALDFYNAMDAVWTFNEYDFGRGQEGERISVSRLVKKITQAHLDRKKGLTDFTNMMDGLVEEQMYKYRRIVETDSDDEDSHARYEYNPLQLRRQFIARVLRSVEGDLSKMTYASAQKFLKELKYIDMRSRYNIDPEDFINAKDDPDVVLNEEQIGSFHFCILVARLRNVAERSENGVIPERWNGLVSFLLKALGVVTVGVVAAVLLKKMFSMLFGAIMKPLGQEEQGPIYDGSKALKTKAPSRILAKGRVLNVTQNAPQLDDKQMMISKNIRFLRIVTGSGKILKMSCIALDSKYIVFPEHFYVEFMKIQQQDPLVKFELEVRRKNHPECDYQPIVVSVQNSVQIEGTGEFLGEHVDGRLVYLSGTVCVGARSIWCHVCTDADLGFYAHSQQQAYLLAPQTGLIGSKAIINYQDFYPYKNRAYLLGRSAVKTIPGDCGRPYVHVSIHAQHCLLGFHTLGVNDPKMNVGLTPLTVESLINAKNMIEAMLPTTMHIEPMVIEEMPDVSIHPIPPMIEQMWETPSMPLLGALKIKNVELERYVPTNTKYLPIKINDKPFKHPNWTNDYLPSRKTPFKLGEKHVHPLFTGSQKYARVATRVAPVRFTVSAFQHYIRRMPVDREARVLTDYEAINGFETMGHLVMTTGAGYWGTWFQKGKTEIFQAMDQRERPDGSVMELEYEWSEKAKTLKIPVWGKTIVEFYQESDERINRGEQMHTFWVSTLKDELLPQEKILIGKTRVFEQPCVVYTLLCRKYFGYFGECFKRHAGMRLHHGIGKDANVVWARYLELLRKHGDYGFDVDYKNYDGTVQPAAFEFFLLVTDHFYGLEGREARHSLIRTLQCSHHLIGKTIAESAQGNKSGNPLTDLFNSITNTWLVYVVYQWCREAHGLPAGMETQPENFDFLTYGDDVIVGASEECMEYFNRVKFAEVAKLLGYTVTAANKSAEITPYESIFDLTFLKRPFVPRNGYVAAPLPKKVIYRELTWETNMCVGNKTIFEERIKTALEFMAHHGYEEYTKLRTELQQLGVQSEDRFAEWEMQMREKQLYPEVEDGLGRFYVEADEIYLDEMDEDMLEIEMEWEGDDWLFRPEE